MEIRERQDNLELLDQLEDEDDLETMDLKETLYDTHTHRHKIHSENAQICKFSRFSI